MDLHVELNGMVSYYTLLLYLTENIVGGETIFIGDE